MGLIHCMQYLRLAFCLSECPIGQRTESYLLPNMDLAEDFFFLINIAVVLFFARNLPDAEVIVRITFSGVVEKERQRSKWKEGKD